MISPEEKAVLVQQQVTAKIRWGADREEVAEWLEEQYGVVDEVAEQMLARAFRARRRAIREQAYVRIAISFAGLAFAAAVFYVRFFSGETYDGKLATVLTGLAAIIGAASLVVFLRNLFRLFTGETTGSVD